MPRSTMYALPVIYFIPASYHRFRRSTLSCVADCCVSHKYVLHHLLATPGTPGHTLTNNLHLFKASSTVLCTDCLSNPVSVHCSNSLCTEKTLQPNSRTIFHGTGPLVPVQVGKRAPGRRSTAQQLDGAVHGVKRCDLVAQLGLK